MTEFEIIPVIIVLLFEIIPVIIVFLVGFFVWMYVREKTTD